MNRSEEIIFSNTSDLYYKQRLLTVLVEEYEIELKNFFQSSLLPKIDCELNAHFSYDWNPTVFSPKDFEWLLTLTTLIESNLQVSPHQIDGDDLKIDLYFEKFLKIKVRIPFSDKQDFKMMEVDIRNSCKNYFINGAEVKALTYFGSEMHVLTISGDLLLFKDQKQKQILKLDKRVTKQQYVQRL